MPDLAQWEYRVQTIGSFFGTKDEQIEATLDEWGEEGWEVVNLIPRRKQSLVQVVEDNMAGAYVLLKRELAPSEGEELN